MDNKQGKDNLLLINYKHKFPNKLLIINFVI